MQLVFVLMLFLVGCDQISPESVVKVHFDNGSKCSGFFTKPCRVVTSSHCTGDDSVTILYVDNNVIKESTGMVISRDGGNEGLVLIDVIAEGTPVKLCDTTAGVSVRHWSWIKDRPEYAKGFVLWHWSNKYVTNASSSSGKSGGPVGWNGCVIGMHHGRTSIGTSYVRGLD